MPPFSRLSGALLACAGLWGACAQPPPLPLEVEYAGCRQVDLPGPVCFLAGDRRLQLWTPDATARAQIRAGWFHRKVQGTAGPDGQRFTVVIPKSFPLGATTVVVEAERPQGKARWSLKLGASRWPAWADRALSLRDQTKLAALLQAQTTNAPVRDQGLAYDLLVDNAFARGDAAAAQAALERAIPAHRSAGRLLGEATARGSLYWLHFQHRRFAAARQALAGLETSVAYPAEATYYRLYYSGLLAEGIGDVRSALADLTAAMALADRLDLAKLRRDAGQVLARQYQALGRSQEANRLFQELRRASAGGLAACEWVNLLNNQAWSSLLAREAGKRTPDPIPLLLHAERLLVSGPCTGTTPRDLQLNIALAHLQQGRAAQARQILAREQDLAAASPLQRLGGIELKARLALLEGRPDAALALYGQLDELAASTLSPASRWQAAAGRAQSNQALGHTAEALAAFSQAEALLDQQSLQIPIQQGRGTFAAQREAATGLYLELLLAQGRNAEALEVARRARSRVLRQLATGDRLAHLLSSEQKLWDELLARYEQTREALDTGLRDEWRLPEDEKRRQQAQRLKLSSDAEGYLDRALLLLGTYATRLPAPRPGELILAYHPLPHGWVGFATEGKSVTAHRFELPENPLPPPRELAARLLEPFGPRIRRARRLRFLPYGVLRQVDFHALPFGSDLLLAAHPVVYGLDLTVPAGSPEPAAAGQALVIGNPQGDLPMAEREAASVAASLRKRPGWTVTALQGQAASAGAVRSVLVRVDLFHYAGHGIFTGPGGWESVLPLARETRLTLGDLLALRRAPRQVVLSACEAGRSDAEAPGEGLGLAQAFLLAGSRQVLAATRPVGDRSAQGLFDRLYDAWSSEPDLAVRLQRAQNEWRHREPTADWSSFRLFEP